MSEIQWLDPNPHSRRKIPKEIDVRVVTLEDSKGITYSRISFYNHSDKKINPENSEIVVGISDTAIYLKAPKGSQRGRAVVRRNSHNIGNIKIVHVDFSEIFKNFDGLQGYFRLQYSASKSAWFISSSGKVEYNG